MTDYRGIDIDELASGQFEANNGFKITNDSMAEWAIKTIKAEEADRDRLVDVIKNEIGELNNKIMSYEARCDRRTSFLKMKLYEYFQTVERKETKTQQSYELPAGKLVFKKPAFGIKKSEDSAKMLDWLKANERSEYIKTEEKVDWNSFKKSLAINAGSIIDTVTGEVIPEDVAVIEESEGGFNVK